MWLSRSAHHRPASTAKNQNKCAVFSIFGESLDLSGCHERTAVWREREPSKNCQTNRVWCWCESETFIRFLSVVPVFFHQSRSQCSNASKKIKNSVYKNVNFTPVTNLIDLGEDGIFFFFSAFNPHLGRLITVILVIWIRGAEYVMILQDEREGEHKKIFIYIAFHRKSVQSINWDGALAMPCQGAWSG